jgi:carbon storage regulator
MLVLTRKSTQKIRIGDKIVITVLKVQGDQVSLGIEAPRDTKIFREELLERCEEQVERSPACSSADETSDALTT